MTGGDSRGDKSDHSEVLDRIFGKLQTFPCEISKLSPHLPSATETARQLMVSMAASRTINNSNSPNRSSVSHVIDATKLPQFPQFKGKVDFPKWDFDLTPLSLRAEQLFTQYLVALVVGVSVGTAVSAGLFGGLLASTNLIRWFQRRNPTLTSLLGFWLKTESTPHQENQNLDIKQNHTSQTKISCMNIEPGTNKILVLQSNLQGSLESNGTQSSGEKSCREEFRSCLNLLEDLMSTANISWNDIIKMTVYLLVDQCASDFYATLEEIPQFAKERTVSSVIFVSRLEHNSTIQIEILALVKH